ncbi:metal-dependent hydrolase [Burkholderia pseudomallei]|uniref:metal-dependent hydrolase n=1 Tax=Burkholderia pseudomallei TaxID=28450 RepID=UPI0005E03E3F|nr:metal-dependent hydrolase [Burkholderia pseudomallei]CPG80214.1 metal-dependent hydrolase [Burkholderia pseudomallei]
MPAIVRRDVRFALPPDRIGDWHVNGVANTHYFNALSLMFPAGERFFIDAVRHYRDRIQDPELLRQVQGFIGQEAMHSREHVEFNDVAEAAGYPAHRLDRGFWRFTGLMQKILPPPLRLAQTIAFEHYTAIMTDMLLGNFERFHDSADAYANMWLWHSMEETEHKAVAFDVWNAVMKPGPARYLMRTGSMLLMSVVFWGTNFYFHLAFMNAHRRMHGKVTGKWAFLRFFLKGMVRIAPKTLAYFKPGFHPWQHDNRRHFAQLDQLLANIDASNARYAAQAAPRRIPLHPMTIQPS